MCKLKSKLHKSNLECLCKSKRLYCLCGKRNRFGQRVKCSSFTKSKATLPDDERSDYDYRTESFIEKFFRKCGIGKINKKEPKIPKDEDIKYAQRLYRLGFNIESDWYTKEFSNYNPNEVEEK